MHRLRLLIIVIGIFHCGLSSAQVETEEKFTGKPKMVDVESNSIVINPQKGTYDIESYVARRRPWGVAIGVSYSTFSPSNYEPNFVAAAYKDVYSSTSLPLIELNFTVKRNFDFGSVGVEIVPGIFRASTSGNADVVSDLQVTPVKLGATLALDTLSPTPVFVPYVSGGAYMVFYKETANDSKFSGNTLAAPYLNGGVAISLDWIDKTAARQSYMDSGILGSFAYIEARTMMASSATKDPDFSSSINFAGGMKIEF